MNQHLAMVANNCLASRARRHLSSWLLETFRLVTQSW